MTYEKENKICVKSRLPELSKIRDFIAKKASESGFAEREAYEIALAVDEACSNLIRHAYRFDENKEICVAADTDSARFTIDILDESKPFDPSKTPEIDMEQYFKQYRKGGLGIHIMHKVMDAVEYIPKTDTDKPNVLRLSKEFA